MDFLEIIRDIRKARASNKLVIFVGSGVSKNSGIPTWNELIVKLAKELDYDNCIRCPEKKNSCSKVDCSKQYDFCQDDYLKIPQYYFNNDISKGHKDYKSVICDSLSCDAEPNQIDDIIFKLLPHHIITTNYDQLLEKSSVVNRRLYSVIKRDADLLSPISNRYIIKMHGDIDNLDEIVLKEDDYINYEHEHILIQTYIKSLLVDHTFLFVGYSLNDYNLKQILGWINYFANKNGCVASLPKNYILQARNLETSHIEKYYKFRNILLLDTSNPVVKCLIQDVPSIISEVGKKTYICLDLVLNESKDLLFENLDDYLERKYHTLDCYRYISFKDLMSVYSLGHCEKKGTTLLFYIEEEYNKIKNVLSLETETAQYICGIFIKARIFEIQYQNESYKIVTSIAKNDENAIFDLYLENKYNEIPAILNNVKDPICRAYYSYICFPGLENCLVELMKAEQNLSNFDEIVYLIIYKLDIKYIRQLNRDSTKQFEEEIEAIIDQLPTQVKESIIYFTSVFYGNESDLARMSRLLVEHEGFYMHGTNSIFAGCEIGRILDLQSLTYDYYFYMKKNYLMLDRFSNPKAYFQPYIKAILCSFSPRDEASKRDSFGFDMELHEYVMNEYDMDMIVKFTSYEDLNSWINYYKVKRLEYDNYINISNRFANLCNSMTYFDNYRMYQQLSTFALLISKFALSTGEFERVVESICGLTETMTDKGDLYIRDLLRALIILAKTYTVRHISAFEKILCNLVQEKLFVKNYRNTCHNEYQKIVSLLSTYTNQEIQKTVDGIIDSCSTTEIKCNCIYIFRKIMNKDQLKKWRYYLISQNSILSNRLLFDLVTSKMLPYSKSILQGYLKTIDREITKRKENPGIRSYPDILKNTIEYCIILFILGKPIDIALLKPYIYCSDYLAFLLEPESFDYSKVDTTDYMWQNFFRRRKLCKVLKQHRNDILSKELEESLSNQQFTVDQYRIIFGILVDSKILWEYGELT